MKLLGDQFEDEATAMLAQHGAVVLGRNYRQRTGEIDIIALTEGYLVFVEVRARSNSRYTSAAASVDRRKQRRIVRTAQKYLQDNPQLADLPCRFDVITFEPPQSPSEPSLCWIRSAFTA